MKLSRYAKAIAALASTFGAGYVAAILDGSPGGTGVTAAEWQYMAVTSVIAAVLVWAVPNSAPAAPAVPSEDDDL